jgi:hypothetical protein
VLLAVHEVPFVNGVEKFTLMDVGVICAVAAGTVTVPPIAVPETVGATVSWKCIFQMIVT